MPECASFFIISCLHCEEVVNFGVTPQGGSYEATVHHGLSVLTSAAPDAPLGSASGPAAESGHSREPHS